MGAKVYKFVPYDGTDLLNKMLLHTKRNSFRDDNMIKYLQPRATGTRNKENDINNAELPVPPRTDPDGGANGDYNRNDGYPTADNSRYGASPYDAPSHHGNNRYTDRYSDDTEAGNPDFTPADSSDDERRHGYGNGQATEAGDMGDRSQSNVYGNRFRFGFPRRNFQSPSYPYHTQGALYGDVGRFLYNGVPYYGYRFTRRDTVRNQGEDYNNNNKNNNKNNNNRRHIAGPDPNTDMPRKDPSTEVEDQSRYSDTVHAKPSKCSLNPRKRFGSICTEAENSIKWFHL